MAIDPLTEDLIWPTEAAKMYPRGPNGKTVHVSRVYRDMKRGLEFIRTPRIAVSRQSVARFFRTLSEASQPSNQLMDPSKAERGRSERRVEQELDRLGI